MSDADKLLYENGFIPVSMEVIRYKKSTRQWREDGELVITFNEDETIDVSFGDRLPIFLSMQELKAINMKCKEMGWIE